MAADAKSGDLGKARSEYLGHLSQWAVDHQVFLDAVFAEFAVKNEWPDVSVMQRRWARDSKGEVDFIDLANELPLPLGRKDLNSNMVILTTRGLAACSQTAELMTDFVRAVKLAYGLWAKSDDLTGPATITRAELHDHLHVSLSELDRLVHVYAAESILHAGQTVGPDKEWRATVSDTIRKFKDVQNIDDYLVVQAELVIDQVTLIRAGYWTPQGAVATQTKPPDGRMNATWMFEDIVDSTKWAQKLGSDAWVDLRSRHDDVVRDTAQRFLGVEWNVTGDGFFISFADPRSAIECAFELVRALEELQLELHIGLHAGEAVIQGKQPGGLPVIAAKRVMERARPKGILATVTVASQLAGSNFRFDRTTNALAVGEQSLDLFWIVSDSGSGSTDGGQPPVSTTLRRAVGSVVDELSTIARILKMSLDNGSVLAVPVTDTMYRTFAKELAQELPEHLRRILIRTYGDLPILSQRLQEMEKVASLRAGQLDNSQAAVLRRFLEDLEIARDALTAFITP